jgi:hypothetical protein
VNADLVCGVCRKRWAYTGGSPTRALDAHHAAEHPGLVRARLEDGRLVTDAAPAEVEEVETDARLARIKAARR